LKHQRLKAKLFSIQAVMPPVALQNLPGHAETLTSPPTVGGRLLSAEEFEALPESNGPCELVNGIIHPLMSNNPVHAHISSNLAFLLQDYMRRQKTQARVMCGEVGVVTSATAPATTRAADLAVISKERLPELPDGPVPVRHWQEQMRQLPQRPVHRHDNDDHGSRRSNQN
jgi:hypothetical protein